MLLDRCTDTAFMSSGQRVGGRNEFQRGKVGSWMIEMDGVVSLSASKKKHLRVLLAWRVSRYVGYCAFACSIASK